MSHAGIDETIQTLPHDEPHVPGPHNSFLHAGLKMVVTFKLEIISQPVTSVKQTFLHGCLFAVIFVANFGEKFAAVKFTVKLSDIQLFSVL